MPNTNNSIAFYSPTVLHSYRIDEDWWIDNISKDSEKPPGFDDEGFDEYGYDKFGRDRAWHTREEYDSSPELYEQIKQDYRFLIHKFSTF